MTIRRLFNALRRALPVYGGILTAAALAGFGWNAGKALADYLLYFQ